MSRKILTWTVLPVLALLSVGCPKKPPAPVKDEIKMDTTRVETPPPTQDIPSRPAPPPPDATEVDPLSSGDLRVVNEEATRLGFSPNVYFEFDKSDLADSTRQALARNADFLKKRGEFTITIEGHCDERGTNEYNLALGERRSNAVKSYLSSLGVATDRMQTISYGEERQVCSTVEESCWSQNRRAHLLITGRRP